MKTNQSIFKFVDFKDSYTIENLKNRELICKYFDDYNDPYESHYGLNAEWPSPYKQQEELRRLISSLEPESADRNTKSIESMREFIDKNRHLRDYTMKVLYDTAKKFRVCSFTRRWNHILMWAHYADGCRGAALIFDQNEILDGDSARTVNSKESIHAQHMPLLWVKYATKPPVINSVKFLKAERTKSEKLKEVVSKDIVEACMLSKYKAWRYEQETRMVTRYKANIEKSPTLYKYNNKALTGIILGNKLTQEQIVEISQSVSPEVELYLTRPSQPRYKLEIHQKYIASDIATGRVKIEVINNE